MTDGDPSLFSRLLATFYPSFVNLSSHPFLLPPGLRNSFIHFRLFSDSDVLNTLNGLFIYIVIYRLRIFFYMTSLNLSVPSKIGSDNVGPSL